MDKPYVRLGDTTTHGGTVLEGDITLIAGGQPVACVGHMVSCPLCNGTFPITTGNNRELSNGRPVARHGDSVACGAQLIASQSYWRSPDYGNVGGSDGRTHEAEAISAAALAATPSDGGICLDCLVKAAAAGNATVARG